MKKKVILLLALMLVGALSASAQYQYYIQIRTNTGGDASMSQGRSYLEGRSGAQTTRLSASSTDNAYRWSFEAVPYANGETAEVGWYYIKNATYGYLTAVDGSGPVLSNTPGADATKWRLIKVRGNGNSSTGEDMFFKLVSKLGYDPEDATPTYGTVLAYSGTGRELTGTDDYLADRSVFLLSPAGSRTVVINDNQEIISNYEPVRGDAVDSNGDRAPGSLGSNTVWTTPLPTPTMDADWNEDGGDINAGHPYKFAPISYLTSTDAAVMFGFYASGNALGDGYYFTRTPENGSMSQACRSVSPTSSEIIVFSVWLRVVTDNADLLAGGNGMHSVGEAVLTYGGSGGAKVQTIPLTVPDHAITNLSDPNDPNAWYFYTYLICSETGVNTHDNRPIVNIEVKNTLSVTGIALLDMDNISTEIRSTTATATFRYKRTNTPQMARQDVHTYERIIYTQSGQDEELVASTKNYYYYRWYKMNEFGQEVYPNRFSSPGTGTQTVLGNGIMYTSNGNNSTTRNALGNGARGWASLYEVRNNAGNNNDFFNSDESTIYCDMSNYTDFTFANSIVTEPTVSLRNVFRFRPASEIADRIRDSIANGSAAEIYKVNTPQGVRLRLTPKYDEGNYWTRYGTGNSTNGTPTKANRIIWYKVDSKADINSRDERCLYTTSNGTYSFRGNISSNSTMNSYGKYLQINTSGKSAGTTEYYVAYAYSSTNQTNTLRRIAFFEVTYDDPEKVGPKALPNNTNLGEGSGFTELFSDIDNKKLIVAKTFDQMDAVPAPLPTPLNNDESFTLHNMGAKTLNVEESSYGFATPLLYSDDGTDNGYHGHHRAPYWNEYGFPRAINSGLTNGTWGSSTSDNAYWRAGGFGWSTQYDAKDITYLKNPGVTNRDATVNAALPNQGNMLYVDAAELPGTVAALNFNESFCAGAKLYITAWIMNLNTASTVSFDETGTGGVRPNLVFVLKTVDSETGREETVKRFYTGDVGYQAPAQWFQVGFDFEIPSELSNNEDLDFRLELRNNGLGTDGNDYAIDQIEVFRSNPGISAIRTRQMFCVPETGEIDEDFSLKMQVSVQLRQLNLEVGNTEEDQNLYFRMLDPEKKNFPRYVDGHDDTDDTYTGEEMYVGTGFCDVDHVNFGEMEYWYGTINLSNFTEQSSGIWTSTEVGYEEMYVYEDAVGDDWLVFYQNIPAYVLNGMINDPDGNFNIGDYWIYVAEQNYLLLGNDCAGVADFKVYFDNTDFELTVGGTEVSGAGSVLPICTNNDVNIHAYATDVTSMEDPKPHLYSYYDWYYGPLDTEPSLTTIVEETEIPSGAANYTYTLTGSYQNTDPNGDRYTPYILFETIENAIIQNADGFNRWLATSEGVNWLTDESEGGGYGWTWEKPNYVGYNQRGAYFRYIIPGYTNREDPTDAVTTATRMSDNDNKDTDHPDDQYSEKKPVDYRTVKNDLEAYRHYFPYEDKLPPANQTQFPVNIEAFVSGDEANGLFVKSIDYNDGTYYSDLYTTPITDATTDVDDYRFGGIYGGSEEWGEYTDPAQPGASLGAYIKNIDDLNRLLARLKYCVNSGFLELYKTNTDMSVETLANFYFVVFPLGVAFNIPDLSIPPTHEQMVDPSLIYICTTPAQKTLKANSWAPDSWLGEVGATGAPAMPYFEIDEDTYIYTVRLPERKPIQQEDLSWKEEKQTSEFVVPMLYFDEIVTARIKLTGVKDETGQDLFTTTNGLTSLQVNDGLVLQEAYIGLVDPKNPNKLLRDEKMPFTQAYSPAASGGYIELPGDPVEVDIRWNLNSNRSATLAFESYPLTHNGYNYFFPDPDTESLVNQEGDPLPIGTEIKDKDENVLYEVWNNKIALSVIADEELKSMGTKKLLNSEGFTPGYTYTFVLEATTADSWSGNPEEYECDLLMPFQLKVVPDTIIWGGDTHSAEWNLDANWYIPQKTTGEYPTYTAQRTDNLTFPPLPETKVIIPAGLSHYPTLVEYENLLENLETGQAGATSPTYYDPNKKIISFSVEQEPYYPEEYVQKSLADIRTTPFIEFDYNYVPNSVDTIHFKHGLHYDHQASELPTTGNAELGNQHLLNYGSAMIDLGLRTMFWYALSSPLHNMYTGDYAFERLNPLVEARLFNTTNPQTGAPSTNWTQSFNTANIELTAGMGYSISAAAMHYPDLDVTDEENDIFTLGDPADDLTEVSYTFPSDKYEFQFYNEISRAKTERIDKLIDVYDDGSGRKYSGRFIYEEKLSSNKEFTDAYGRTVITSVPTGNVLASIPVKTGGSDALNSGIMVIGNPLMSHLDFEKFYAANYHLIEPKMQILYPGGSTYVSISGTDEEEGEDPTGSISDVDGTDPLLTFKSIPPMQTFVVTLREEADPEEDKIVITKEMGVVYPDSRLRSSSSEVSRLDIRVTGLYDMSTRAIVRFDDRSSESFYSPEDTRRLFNSEVGYMPNVFTITNGMYLDINRMGHLPESLPIGIQGGIKGAAKLMFSGFDSLDPNFDIYFLDVEKDRKIRIEEDSYEYSFDYDGKKSIGRFYLQMLRSTTGIDDVNKNLSIYSVNRQIEVLSLDGSEIKEVAVYSLNGTLLQKLEATGRTHISIPQPDQHSVVVVKAVTETTSLVEKIINK
ncbi:hypothetical protein LJC52_04830 [Bacteroidales bacterium OttesenSCG-928-A17]|nr:hypothetical protein [Bacteroidales bacterium OttesenSCG-928-A17]